MKTIVLILPYFGNAPKIFPLFLKTAKSNRNIHFLLINDFKEEFDYPENFTVLSLSFSSFKKLLEERLAQAVTLEDPYKLCDYKPTYGYVLCDYVKQYDYWGYCDCDLIWGDLSSFIAPLMENNYDKIFASGHLTLFRNIQENNELFRAGEAKDLFERVSYDRQIYWFDEDYKGINNIHDIFLKNGKKVFSEDLSLNFNIDTNCLQRRLYSPAKRTYIDLTYKGEQYYWEKGRIFEIYKQNNAIERKEFPYMHFQLRHMKGINCALHEEQFKIVPNRFLKCDRIPLTLQDWKSERKWYFGGQRLIQLKRRVDNKIKKVIVKCQ